MRPQSPLLSPRLVMMMIVAPVAPVVRLRVPTVAVSSMTAANMAS